MNKEMNSPKMIRMKDPMMSLMMFNCRQNSRNNRKMKAMRKGKIKKSKEKIMYKMNHLKKNNSAMMTKIIKENLHKNKINKNQNRS